MLGASRLRQFRLLLLALSCAAVLISGIVFASFWSSVLLDANRAGGATAAQAGYTASAIALALLLAGAAALAGASIAHQRLADALRTARADRQALIGLLEVSHWQSDREHRITEWRAPEGSAAPQRTVLWERFRSDPADRLADSMRSRAAFADLPVSLLGSTGNPESWLLRAAPRFDAQGRFDGYNGTARAVEAAPRAIAAPSPEAEDGAAFSYTVSHDLRAPVRVVEGFTRIVKEDYGRLLDRIGIDHLDRVLGAAARMNSMIDALLALSRLAQQPLVRQPVNLSQLAGYVVDDLRRGAPERAVDVRIRSDLRAEGDPTLLRVALENLLGNAWKYTLHAKDAHIDFESVQRDGTVVYVVRDNGAGFDMRFSDRLFGAFQRLHSASDFPGTGIGLASVRRIVRRHSGTIWAESEPGRGATFYFTLS